MRLLHFAGVLGGSAITFVMGLLAAVLLHLNTPLARRVVAAEVSHALTATFRGQVTIDRLGTLGLFGASGVDATVSDQAGRPLLEVRGARASVASWGIVRSALFEKNKPVVIRLPESALEGVDVRLDADASGKLALVAAFEPRMTSPPSNASTRGVRLVLVRVLVRHAAAFGRVTHAPPVDLRVDDLRGAFTYAPDLVEGSIANAVVSVRDVVRGSDLDGCLQASAKKLADAQSNWQLRAAWRGSLGGIAHTAHASLQKRDVVLVADVPEATPDDLARLWSHSSIDQIARAHVEAHGTLPNLDVDLEAALGSAWVHGTAHVSAGPRKTARLALAARNIDVHEFVASAPRSRLDVSAQGSAAMSTAGAISGQVAARFLGGSLGRYRLPPAWLDATFSRGVARFSLDADFPDLGRLDVSRNGLRGSGRLAARGSLDLRSVTVDANLEAAADELSLGPATAGRIALDAHAAGDLADPSIDIGLHSRDVVVKGIRLSSLDAHATGRAAAPHLDASAHGPDIPDTQASLDARLGAFLALKHIRVDMSRAGEQAVLLAERCTFGGQEVRLEGVRAEGLGAPATADLTLTAHALRLRASTQGIDLARIGRLAHLERQLERGTLALDANLDLRSDDASGRVDLELDQATIGGVPEISALLRAHLDGHDVVGEARAQAAGVGFVNVTAPRLSLPGVGALSWTSWRRAWGDVAIEGRVDLDRIAAVIPARRFPLSEAHGNIVFQGHIERDDLDDTTPDLGLSVRTDHLVLAPRTSRVRDIDGVWVMPPPPWRIAGIDFNLDATVDGNSGSLGVSTQVRDARGELARIRVTSAHPPWDDLLRDTRRLAADLRTTPFDLRVSVPERGLGRMPPLLKQGYVTGKLRGDFVCTGTILAPSLHLVATLKKSHIGATARPLPLEFDLTADYDRNHGSLALSGQARGNEVLHVRATFDGAPAEFFDSGDGLSRWQASAQAHFARFPLDALAVLDDKLISGELSGDLTLADFHKDARATAALAVDALRVGSVGYKSARLAARADGQIVDGSIRVDHGDGFVDARAHAAASWGAAGAPRLDPASPVDVSISAKNFRIAGLLPFVDRWLDELDGRLDADARVVLSPVPRRVQMDGGIALTRGAVEAVAGGGEFHDIAATARFLPDGTVTLERLDAAGVTGHVQANGAARLDGLSLRSARLALLVPGSSPIPLAIQGTEVGNVDGRIDMSEVTSGDGRTMAVNVDVPHLRVALPQGVSKRVQALGRIADLRIGAHRGPPQTLTLFALDSTRRQSNESAPGAPATRISVQTRLYDVEVVRDSDLKIELTGDVEANVAGATQVTGQIRLRPGGALVVQGRKFKVENGTVTFVGGNPSNPQVAVKASWTAPDRTVVYANFVGPLETGKVTLSSEPPLARQEIIELLAFGTPGGKQVQSPSADPTSTALGTVGGEAARPLNHALNQLGLGAFTAKIDTSESSTPKPEVEVQIAKDISVQIAIILGQPPPGVNPDRTLLTLDWRFLSRWSLLSTLGDAGTAIFDVVWQRRY